MDFSIVDPSVAEIIVVRYDAALTGITETSSCPFSNGHIGWVDTNEIHQAPGGEERILLATITFWGKLPGTTLLKTTMTMVTDDKGDNLIPSSVIKSPTIIVAREPAVGRLPLPDCAEESVPLDPDKDGAYEDLNGDNQVDIMDVPLFFINIAWIRENEPVSFFDFNGNAVIDFGDIIALYQEM